jgi:large subunit ribosomal protein L23
MALLDRFKKKEKKEAPAKQKEIKEKKPVLEEVALDKKKETTKPAKKVSRKVTPQVYQIIREPHITEKATWLTDQNKYVFKIYPKANKVEVKKAVEALYGVKVEKVHIVHLAPKKRRLGRYEGWRQGLKKGFKKAIVTLKQGEKIELLPR